MSYTSPWINPEQYSHNVTSLSSEGIAIDQSVAGTVRDAHHFASNHSANFSLVNQLETDTTQFSNNWTTALQSSRDAASAVSGWLLSFDKIYLAMINGVSTEGDAHDLVKEYTNFLQGGHPTQKYQLDSTPGPKIAFEEIEGLVDTESNHVIQSVQGNDWSNGLKILKDNLPAVQQGVEQVRGTLNSYATKLE